MRFLSKSQPGLVLVVFLMMVSSLTWAESLKLGQVLRSTLSNHPSVLIKQRELEVKRHELDAAHWGRWPTFGLSSKAFDDGYELTARLEQPLWAGGQIEGQIDLSLAQSQLAEQALAEARYRLLLETLEGYFNLLRLERRIQAAKAAEAELALLQEMIERRVEQQVNPKSDAVLAAARLRQALNERLQYERQWRDAKVKLMQSMNRSFSALRVPGAVPMDLGRDLQAWQDLALAFSPVRQRLEAELAASEADIVLSKAKVLPKLVVGHEQSWTERDAQTDRDGRTYLALNVESGAGLSSRSVVSAARSRKDTALASLRQTELDLRLQVANLWTEWQSLSEQLLPLQALLTGSEEIVESYLKQFQVGKKSWLDVLNAQKEKTQAFYMLTDVEMPLLSVQLRLLVLSGEVNAANLERMNEW
jgi:adhesin transport system outer membrane protein